MCTHSFRTEKNACQWSEDKLKELLKGFKIENDNASAEIIEVEKLEGEAVVNNRKGKLIFFYEWDIILKWRGSMNDNDEEVDGKINIPNLSEENKVDEIDVSIFCILLLDRPLSSVWNQT